MPSFEYALEGKIKDHKLISFTATTEAWDLVGNWSAVIGPKDNGEYDLSQFQPGTAIDFEHLKKGLITGWSRGDDGQILLSGYNAGGWLYRTLGAVSALPAGGSVALMQHLASRAGLSLSASGGLSGFNARSLVTATTVAEALVELAQLSGLVLYIDNDGKVQGRSPILRNIAFPTVLSDNGRNLDLDAYATGVTVILYRRKKTKEEESGGTEGGKPQGPFMRGTTPSGNITEVRKSGEGYAITTLEPIGQVKKTESNVTIQAGGDTITLKETADYVHNITTGTRWEGNREVRWFRWVLEGYTKVRERSGAYTTSDGRQLNFKETTTETYALTWSWITNRKETERIEKRTVREPKITGQGLSESPPYDLISTTTYTRDDLGRRVIRTTNESVYEKMDIGRFAPLRSVDNPEVLITDHRGVPKVINGSVATEWVERIKASQTIENISDDGGVDFSSTTTSDDEGAHWIIKNGAYLVDTDLTNETPAQKVARETAEAYAIFTDGSDDLDVSAAQGGQPCDVAYDELVLQGMERYWHSIPDTGVPVNGENWYDPATGGYVPSAVCPHYDTTCEIYELPVVWTHEGKECPYRGRNWRDCPRALAALEQVKSEEDTQEFEPPVVCTAGTVDSGAHHVRKIYIAEFLTEAQARSIGQQIASNLLKIKGARGIRQSVTVPLDTSLAPDGTIVSVSHDFKALKSSVSYRVDERVPDILLPDSVASAAYQIGERERNRNMRSVIGEVIEIDKATGRIKVLAENTVLNCSTKLKWLGVGDQVTVELPAGNGVNGTITARA